jgi:alpha-tubulin suppressor-like RCC1 family protein
MTGDYPQITFRVKPVFTNLYNYPLPGDNRERTWYQIEYGAIWIDYVPYKLKHGDIFNLYGAQALDVYTRYILETPPNDRILEFNYYGKVIDNSSNLIILNNVLPTGAALVYYSKTLQTQNTKQPLQWEITSGKLPLGIYLDSSTGELYGTPSISGIYPFTISLTDSSIPPIYDIRTYLLTIASSSTETVSDQIQQTGVQTALSGAVIAVGYAGDILTYTTNYTAGNTTTTTVTISGTLVLTLTHSDSYNSQIFTYVHQGITYVCTFGIANIFGVVTTTASPSTTTTTTTLIPTTTTTTTVIPTTTTTTTTTVIPTTTTTTPVPLVGNLLLWGGNTFGQLGDGTTVHRSSPVQEMTNGSWKYLNQTSSETISFAGIKNDGTLWMWGANYFAGGGGLLGVGDVNDRSSPVQTLAGGNDWSVVSTGLNHAAAIKTNGTLWTWGFNSNGQLGNNSIISTSSPAQLGLNTTWANVLCSVSNTIAIKTDGTMWAWGNNDFGKLGLGNTVHRSSPIQIPGTWDYIALNATGSSAIKSDGTLWMWGANTNGTLGNGNLIHRSSPVQTIAGGTNWSKVAATGSAFAAIKTDGTLWGWGINGSGQLGDNTFINRSSPVQTIAGGTNWSKLIGFQQGFAAIKSDGTLWLWGRGVYGTIGKLNVIDYSSPVQTIINDNQWLDLGAGILMVAATRA